jgi:hypothetical protein
MCETFQIAAVYVADTDNVTFELDVVYSDESATPMPVRIVPVDLVTRM